MLENEGESGFSELYSLIQQRTGLTPDANRFAEILRTLGLTDTPHHNHFYATIAHLMGETIHSPVWQKILRIITIGETYFFRGKGHYDALQNHILPPLIEERRRLGQRYLRIWSAGCSTGEEPYSVAMLLREMLPDIRDWSITIIGTDVNTHHLESAQRGIYTQNSFRTETRDHIRNRWFTEEGRHFALSNTIRSMVMFKTLNLISDDYPSYETNTMNMDVVLCRNVTIYFTRAETEKVINRLHQSISHGGWLIVGHSEPQSGVYDAFKVVNMEGAVFYHKPPIQINQKPAPKLVNAPVTHKPIIQPPPAPTPAPSARASIIEAVPVAPIQEDRWMMAKTAADREEWDMAMTLLNAMTGADLLRPQVHYLRALVFMHKNRTNLALAALKQAIYCDPNFVLAHYLIGDVYERQKLYRDARRHWKIAQQSLVGKEQSAHIEHGDELTVEMLHSLIVHRMESLPRD